jgi:hypothetical protein
MRLRSALIDQRRDLTRDCVAGPGGGAENITAGASEIAAIQQIIAQIDLAIEDERALRGPTPRYRIGS